MKSKWFELIMPTISDSCTPGQRAGRLDVRGHLMIRAPEVVRVWPGSPKGYRNAVLQLARFLMRECHYDFPPYSADSPSSESVAYLLVTDAQQDYRELVLGCALMSPMEWDDVGEWPTLAWVWLHPYCRQGGWLTALWPLLEAEHGDFFVQPPFSPGMVRFLLKRGWSIEGWRERRGLIAKVLTVAEGEE